ncbi:MAG: copper chaperone PCu(A)C [Thermomonas sp.]|uniref:copper chaperone PCu(A)C n=1 Tax=Thermomonas sp. TaxID=1971895 RepID=UPI001EB24519|nr:copper chaperone PCu(A)C [Thermomonas sp.]MBV2208829.1 copper chaperone PCu(A)C [Thermomonas sp.]
MNIALKSVCAFLLGLGVTAPVYAQLRVEQAWTRATPVVSPVLGGFLVVTNSGDTQDRLLRVEAAIAKSVVIHQMRNDNGVLRMRAVKDGLPISAHGKLELKPGGAHLMLMGVQRQLRAGEQFEAKLVFEHAGEIPVRFDVRALTAGS